MDRDLNVMINASSQITLEASIGDALKALDDSAQQITFVVSSDDVLIATVTDGDVRRGLLRGLTLSTSVMEVANKSFISMPPSSSRSELIEIMKGRSLLNIPIVDDAGRIVSLCSLKDLVSQKQSSIKNPVVVMAGGKGTRLRPYTENCPKPMLLIDGKPILESLLEKCISNGFNTFYFSVNYLKDHIIDYFGDGSGWGVTIDYLIEEKPLGTAGSLQLLPKQDLPFLVINGDVLTSLDLVSFLDFHLTSRASASMAVWRNLTTIPFGVVEVDDIDLLDFKEKPTLTHLVNAGIYVLDPSVLNCILANQYMDMPTLLSHTKSSGSRVVVFPLHEYWLDVGRPESFEQAHREWPALEHP
ncbi:nucleotidyltransferase family protein [bacterium]|nr:nucleotidyltransferase family protein [bacterium]